MDTLLVSSVEPYAPGDESASVTLRSNSAEIVAFCWPCALHVGDRIENHLSALDGVARAAYLSDWPEDERIERSKQRLEKVGPYAYQGCGRVIDRDAGLIEVLGFHIEIGEIPCEGSVEFECLRLSV
jgi:hypothetical protein